MKTSTKLFVALAAVAMVVAMQPAEAACGNAYLIGAGGKKIVSNPSPCADLGGYCYSGVAYPGDAQISPAFDAVFWSMTTGNPALGVGDDSGAFGPSNWVETYFFPSIGYYRDPTIIAGTNWTQAGDGCVDTQATDGSQCTCMGMFDEWDSVGYFALLSDQADSGSNYDFQPWIPGDLQLAPVPAPQVVSSTRAGTDVILTVSVPCPTAGLYLDPACGPCAEIRYEVYQAIVPRGAASPADRDASWTLVPGGPAGGSLCGDTVQVTSACGAAENDLWLTTRLIVDSGFQTFYVSGDPVNVIGDPLQVQCGPNLADPIDLDARPRPTRPKGKGQIGRPSRGR